MKALIVSRNKMFLKATGVRLRGSGVTTTVSAQTAVETFEAMIREEESFDFIILTQDLPDLNGTDLCKVIRTTPGYEITPVMIILESIDRKGTDMAFLAGATDCRERSLGSTDIPEWLRLVQEIRQTYKGSRTTHRRSGEYVLATPSDLSNKACIRGVNSFVDRFAIDNYVARLPRGTQFNARVFPVSINNFSEISRELSFDDFGLLLLAVGGAIAKACRFEHQLFCYNGNGQYLCVHLDQTQSQRGATEELIRSAIRRIDLEGGAIVPSGLDISVGRIVRANGIFRSSRDLEQEETGATQAALKEVFPSRRRIVTRFLTA